MERNIWRTSETHLDNTGKTDVTEGLQALIDAAAAEGGMVLVERGTYLTASLFLKSGMEFRLEEGAVLLGTTDESRYPVIRTRVAGVEMDWYPGILNCNGQQHVTISGPGTIDGQGEYWWDKYWGPDEKSGMRGEYDKKGLRWACDYDCRRVRNVVVMDSSQVELKDFTSTRSGFWNVHICYSSQVHVDGIRITACGLHSPSTDGIDIDSSEDVLVEHCVTSCNDDSICIKSGRDADGLRVGRPCRRIVVQDCEIQAGFGVTIGSEVSGGVSDVTLRNIRYRGTDCGFRIKSSIARRGYIRNVLVENLDMVNVKYLFHMCLNWNPAYSYCSLPEGYACDGGLPESWQKLLERIPDEVPLTQVSDIEIRNVKARYEDDYDGISRAFHLEGFASEPIRRLTFRDMDLSCKEFGVIDYTRDIRFEHVSVSVSGARDEKNDSYDNR